MAGASIDFRFSFVYSARMLPLTKRQREILDFLNEFIQQHGYAPSLEEIGRRFNLSSLATVHKHLTNLQEKGFIKRAWNRSRSVEMVPNKTGGRWSCRCSATSLRVCPSRRSLATKRLQFPKTSWASERPTCCASRGTR